LGISVISVVRQQTISIKYKRKSWSANSPSDCENNILQQPKNNVIGVYRLTNKILAYTRMKSAMQMKSKPMAWMKLNPPTRKGGFS
jgi:hypothetical protein